jgi:hypothetical protein
MPSRTSRCLPPLAALGAATFVLFSTAGVRADSTDPVPVLGGRRVLAPGPPSLGFEGLRADPSSIGNFRGTVALAYLRARVRDSTGHRWLMENDIRVVRGSYVSADGMTREGAFAFV